jgi:hypothetical protein
MKKNLNTSLYTSLINSDFFLLENPERTKISYFQGKISTKQHITSLNLLELNKSIKQFIRSLQFLKNEKNSSLYININNKQNFNLFKQYFNLHPAFVNVVLKSFIQNDAAKSRGPKMQLDISTNGQKNLNFSQTPYLLTQINLCRDYNKAGTYKMYNSLGSTTKNLFLLALIENI